MVAKLWFRITVATLILISLLSPLTPYSAASQDSVPTPAPTPTHVIYLPLILRTTASPTIIDCDGQPATQAWLYATFGNVTWTPGSGSTLTNLRCSIGPAVLVVHVQDQDGHPIANQTVVRYWPGAPPLPPSLCYSPAYCQGVYGPTNQNGDIGFGLGFGDYYLPPTEQGASCIWLPVSGSTLLCGLGMLGFTNHQHLNSTWTVRGTSHIGQGAGVGRTLASWRR